MNFLSFILLLFIFYLLSFIFYLSNMPKQVHQRGRRWYVIHTYSGYEENVAENLRQRIE